MNHRPDLVNSQSMIYLKSEVQLLLICETKIPKQKNRNKKQNEKMKKLKV